MRAEFTLNRQTKQKHLIMMVSYTSSSDYISLLTISQANPTTEASKSKKLLKQSFLFCFYHS